MRGKSPASRAYYQSLIGKRRKPLKTEQTCKFCGETKLVEHFYVYNGHPGNVCRGCNYLRSRICQDRNPDAAKARQIKATAKRKADPDKSHKIRWANYRMTREQYEGLVSSQHGVCKICGRPPSGRGREKCLHVDHDHSTGRVRGLLCDGCNRGLGYLRDNPAALRAGAEYLETSNTGIVVPSEAKAMKRANWHRAKKEELMDRFDMTERAWAEVL